METQEGGESVSIITHKHYKYGQVEGKDYWYVTNIITKRIVNTSSESAARKIVELAVAIREGLPKPFNHSTLERKAKTIEGLDNPKIDRYYKWDGKPRAYRKWRKKK